MSLTAKCDGPARPQHARLRQWYNNFATENCSAPVDKMCLIPRLRLTSESGSRHTNRFDL